MPRTDNPHYRNHWGTPPSPAGNAQDQIGQARRAIVYLGQEKERLEEALLWVGDDLVRQQASLAEWEAAAEKLAPAAAPAEASA